MRILIILASLMLISSCASNKNAPYVKHIDQSINIPSDISLALKVEKFEQAPFHGEVNYDGLGVGHGPTLYPGAGPAGFAASILVHAAVVGTAGDVQKRAEQEKADKVLEPYADVIDQLDAADLVASSLDSLAEQGVLFDIWSEEYASPWVVQSSPVFFLSPDQSTLVLKNAVSVFPADSPDQPAYQNLIEVISSPQSSDDGTIAVDSLRDLSATLFADSLSAVRAELADTAERESKEMTLHFYSGGKKVYERGRVISRTCDRMTFRSLRGWVKSVPAVDGDVAGDCLIN